MKKTLFLLTVLTAMICSCDDGDKDEDVYPSIITELADVDTDADGVLTKMRTDNGKSYSIVNRVSGLKESSTFRILCGYTPVSDDKVNLLQAQLAYYLCDSTSVLSTDPTPVLSVWRAGRYINMQLAPLTQGGVQYWGFAVDKVEGTHTYLSLHHNQNGDPASYTKNVYASLDVNALTETSEGDIITLTINTPKGEKTWNFVK